LSSVRRSSQSCFRAPLFRQLLRAVPAGATHPDDELMTPAEQLLGQQRLVRQAAFQERVSIQFNQRGSFERGPDGGRF
ncbi:hypothetical protein CLOP_g1619, partial [Closterium sp. NIES-67]